MTDLERRALLGDAEAQRECTEKGIVLAFPCCGKYEVLTFNSEGVVYHSHRVECALTGRFAKLKYWNRRAAPPIGRCGECAAYVDSKCMNTG